MMKNTNGAWMIQTQIMEENTGSSNVGGGRDATTKKKNGLKAWRKGERKGSIRDFRKNNVFREKEDVGGRGRGGTGIFHLEGRRKGKRLTRRGKMNIYTRT